MIVRRDVEGDGTLRLKRPSASVEVPTVVPATSTEAPTTGRPPASTTRPDTVAGCSSERFDRRIVVVESRNE